jgi:hypothetical protein
MLPKRIQPGTLGQKGIMKYTTVKISEIRQHPTMRLDPGYWIKKKSKKKKAASLKLQAPSSVDNGSRSM